MTILEKYVADRASVKMEKMSPRVARFQAERETTLEAIQRAQTVEELREVLLVMHRKIYS